MKDGNAASFIGDIPTHYDQGLGPNLFADYATDIARRVAAGAPRDVLELAAGTGIVTRKLRDALGSDASLTATDLNEAMLAVARGKFTATERIDFAPANAQALPFGAGAFDTVVCQFGIMFFPDKEASFRETARVLRAGGRYVFNVWDALSHNRLGSLVEEVLGSIFPGDAPAFMRTPFGYHHIDPIKQALQAAGFGALRIEVLPMEKQIADIDALARGQIFGSPIADQVRARGGDPVEAERELAAAMRRLFVNARMPMQAIVFEATKG